MTPELSPLLEGLWGRFWARAWENFPIFLGEALYLWQQAELGESCGDRHSPHASSQSRSPPVSFVLRGNACHAASGTLEAAGVAFFQVGQGRLQLQLSHIGFSLVLPREHQGLGTLFCECLRALLGPLEYLASSELETKERDAPTVSLPVQGSTITGVLFKELCGSCACSVEDGSVV